MPHSNFARCSNKSMVPNTIPHSNFIPHSSPQIIYNLTWPTGSMKGSNFTPRLNKVASSNTFLIQTSLSLQTQSLVPNTFPHSNFTPRSNKTYGKKKPTPHSNFIPHCSSQLIGNSARRAGFMKGSNFTPRSNRIYASKHNPSFKLHSPFKENL